MANETVVSVIIPTLNKRGNILQLLASLERQICSVPFEVIVISNLPRTSLRKGVAAFGSRFRYFETGKIGVNRARNKGLSKARGKIALFLDDDCYMQDRIFIQKHYDLHVANPDVIGIGGRYLIKPEATTLEKTYHWILDQRMTNGLLDGLSTRYLVGGNSSYKIDRIGRKITFDERIVIGGSELDLCAKLRREGHQLLLFDNLAIEHRVSLGIFEYIRRAYLQGHSSGTQERKKLVPTKPHWNSTISFEQNMRRSGAEVRSSFNSYSQLYRRHFNFGYRMGLRAEDGSSTKSIIKSKFRPDPAWKLGEFLKDLGGRWVYKKIPHLYRQFKTFIPRAITVALGLD